MNKYYFILNRYLNENIFSIEINQPKSNLKHFFILTFIVICHIILAILAYNYAIISYENRTDEIEHYREKIFECKSVGNQAIGFTLYDICFWKSSIFVFGVGAFLGKQILSKYYVI